MQSKKQHKKQPRRKLTGDERRRAILEAAIPLFTQEGFKSVTTKRLAQAAGVSEALLYQHFPSKEAVYAEVQDHFCAPPQRLRSIIEDLPPSTESLVTMLFFLTKVIVENDGLLNESEKIFPRLMLSSILDDGAFARMHIERRAGQASILMQRCLAAARAGGDLVDGDTPDDVRFWLCHHTLVSLHIYNLPDQPVVSYSVDRRTVARHAMTYMLRGIGLTPEATRRHYDHERLDAKVSAWLASVDEG